MANTKVEILGNQLSGTIANAASESTLQEIVRSVNAMNKNISKSSSPPSGGGMSAPSAPGPSSMIGAAAGMVADQIGNIVGAMGSFAGLLAAGNDKISAYTDVLNQQVIKNIPLVGKVLGVFGDTISYTIEQFESWNGSLKASSKSGATFNNSILQMREAAARTFLSVDDFVGIINKNSEFLAGFGGTVTEGAMAFAEYNASLNKQGGVGREIFRQIGYSAKDVSEAQMKFMKNTMRGQGRKKLSDDEFNKQFASYQLNLDKLSKISGLTVEQLEEQMAVATQDLQYQRRRMELGTDGANKLDQGLAVFTTLFGKTGVELYKALALHREPFGMEAQILKQTIEQSGLSMAEVIAAAENGNVKLDAFEGILRNAYGKSAGGIIEMVKRNDKLLNVYSQLDGGNNEFNRALSGASASYLRFTRDGKTTVANALEGYDAAKKEKDARDPLTKFLNDMALAFDTFKQDFIIALLPWFKRLSKALENYDISGMIQSFGQALVKFVQITIPTLDIFFKKIQTEEGQAFIRSELQYLFDKMMIFSKYAFMRAFTKQAEWKDEGITKEDEEKEQKAAVAGRVSRAQALGYSNITEGSNFLGAEPLKTPVSDTRDDRAPSAGGPIVTPGGQNVTEKTLAAVSSGKLAGLGSPLPAGSFRFTSGVGPRNGPNGSYHFGNDLAPTQQGDIPVTAIARGFGRGSFNTNRPEGNMMKIYHPDQDITSIYMHLDPASIPLMNAINARPDGKVEAGETIGFMGSTGTNRDGSRIPKHLHFQTTVGDWRNSDFKFNENVLDPKTILKYNKGTMGTPPSDAAQLSIDQMENIAAGGSDMNLQQLMSDFNANMATLISLTQERQNLHREQIDHTRRLSGNILG